MSATHTAHTAYTDERIAIALSRPQREMILDPCEQVAFIAGRGSGKAQPIDSPTLTPTGWRAIGDLLIGDEVIGSNGKPVKVTGVHPQGPRQVYRITFHDGSSAECCAEHLWTVARRGRPWRTVDTKAIIARYRSGRTRPNIDWLTPTISAPITFAQQEKLPLDPYLLGVLLGNGHFGKGCVLLSSVDREVVESVRSALPAGTELVKGTNAPDYAIRSTEKRDRTEFGQFAKGSPILDPVRSLGLSEKLSSTKFVPEIYKTADAESRLALVRGLMDTDGTVSRDSGSASFCTTSKQLAEDLRFLVMSLCGEARISGPHRKTFTHNGEKKVGQPAWNVTVKMMRCPFKLSRKADLWVKPTKYQPAKIMHTIAESRIAECVCITVDAADSLYVTNGFILTHNSFVGARWAYSMACDYPKALGLITANSYQQLHQATLKALFDFLRDNKIPFSWNRDVPWYDSRFRDNHNVLSFPNGAQVVCRSLDNYDDIRGAEYGWWWADETRDTRREAYDVALACLRDKNGPRRARFTTTPNGYDWLYTVFHDEPLSTPGLQNRRKLIRASTHDNRDHLPEGFIEMLEASYSPEYARQEIYGEFANIGTSTAYSCFSRAVHVKDDIILDPSLPIALCCDFNVTPMAWVIGQHQKRGDVVIDEIWRERPREGLSATDSAALDFCDRYSQHKGGIRLYCDASGDSRHVAATTTAYRQLVEVLRQRCALVSLHKPDANPPVVDRVAAVNARLKNMKGEIRLLVSRRCQKLIRDLEQVTWKRPGELDPGPKKELGHISDSLGYWQHHVYGFGVAVGYASNRATVNNRVNDIMRGIQ